MRATANAAVLARRGRWGQGERAVAKGAMLKRSGPAHGLMLWAVLLAAMLPPPAQAHRLAPSLLSLTAVAADEYEAHWKTSRYAERGQQLTPQLPAGCTDLSAPAPQVGASGIAWRWRVRCADPLVGQTIAIDGLEHYATTAVLVELREPDGRALRQVLTPDQPSWQVPAARGVLAVLRDYFTLGVEHILLGWDHLAFVAGLMLLAPGWRRLLVAVTGFTAGHSVTLAGAALGVLRLPQGLVEIAIALSIFYVAQRAVSGADRAPPRWPGLIVLSAGFGLLHGAGFAGALAETGLPDEAIVPALAAFNVGIEIGQLGFVLAAGAAVALVLRLGPRAAHWSRGLVAYGIGSVGAFWAFERALAGWV